MSTQWQQYGSHPLGGMLKIEDFGRYVRIQRHLWVAVVIRSSVHDIYEKTISSCVRIFGEMNKVDIGIINFWNFILDNNSLDSLRSAIFYTLDEIQEDLNCGHEKAVKLLSELDTDKGCGLIERVKQGQGRPTKIYVKRFTTRRVPAETPAPQETPRLPKIGSQEVGKSEVKSSDNPKSRLPIFRSADFGKSDGNYIESNQTDFSYKNQSIHPSPSAEQPGWMDRSEYLREIKENIEYPFLCQQFNADDVDEVVGLMADVMCSTQSTVRIGGENIPLPQVQARFYRLDYSLMVYVFECLRRNTTQVRNIRAYLLTTLFNAPLTMNNHYQAEVQHDFGP